MGQPLVSIIIPIYKTEKYLRNCLLSVQRQTMPNFEAILVNDCSPDESMLIAKEFVDADARFRIFELKTNQGTGYARNLGLEEANGKYVNFLDSDDSLPMDAIEVMLKLAKGNQADMVIGNMAWISGNQLNPVEYINNRLLTWFTYRYENLRNISENAALCGSICHHLIETKIVRDNKINFPEGVLHEDVPFSMKVWFFSEHIVSTLRYVYFRTKRYEANNLSRTQIYDEKAFHDRDEIANQIYDFAYQHTSNNENAARLGSITLLNMLSTTKNMLFAAEEKINLKITTIWFPSHVLRINKMVNNLNVLSKRFKVEN